MSIRRKPPLFWEPLAHSPHLPCAEEQSRWILCTLHMHALRIHSYVCFLCSLIPPKESLPINHSVLRRFWSSESEVKLSARRVLPEGVGRAWPSPASGGLLSVFGFLWLVINSLFICILAFCRYILLSIFLLYQGLPYFTMTPSYLITSATILFSHQVTWQFWAEDIIRSPNNCTCEDQLPRRSS